ncbi:MAG TPA: hypothetical protein VIT91_02485 [Chthoniobacterales bacterium]
MLSNRKPPCAAGMWLGQVVFFMDDVERNGFAGDDHGAEDVRQFVGDGD